MSEIVLEKFTYMGFDYPIELTNVEISCADGTWAPVINREAILERESKRLLYVFYYCGKWLNEKERKVLNEGLDKGYITLPEKKCGYTTSK